MESHRHPTEPRSNVQMFGGYDPNNYEIAHAPSVVVTDEALLPSRPPCFTQKAIAMYLKPLTKELDEVPPRPTVAELPDAVIDKMVQKDKAFWVDKPGVNAYIVTDALYAYGMTASQVQPHHQAVFPRSYQFDLDCVKYRRLHACDTANKGRMGKKPAYCRDCQDLTTPVLTRYQLAWTEEAQRQRWRNYPNLTKNLSVEEVRTLMSEVGRPFKNEACNWYYEHYPAKKYPLILRKCGK